MLFPNAVFAAESHRTRCQLSNHSSLDRESFQKLLASAFAVQESGMKPQSLAAIVELQRSIRMGRLDVEGAAHLIAEWARSVANASGVAIGRLKGDELIYTAGSGSAASFIGRRIMATFNNASPNETPSEILWVEDTKADGRIEAAVCRQFGVESLLILPIYRGRFVAGVLQIFFNEAHSFQGQEVRIYWILAGLVGEAMLGVPSIDKRTANVATAVSEEVIEHFPAPLREPVNQLEPSEVTHVRSKIGDWSSLINSFVPLCKNHLRVYRLRAYNLHPYRFLQYMRHRVSALVVGSIILISAWVLSTTSPATMSSAAVPPLKSPSVRVQNPQTSASEGPVTTTSAGALPAQVGYPRVRSMPSARQPRLFDLESRVKHFGSDVTVRYFTPRVATVKMAADTTVHHVSDDVTVRYFKPRNVASPAEPVATGPSKTVAR